MLSTSSLAPSGSILSRPIRFVAGIEVGARQTRILQFDFLAGWHYRVEAESSEVPKNSSRTDHGGTGKRLRAEFSFDSP